MLYMLIVMKFLVIICDEKTNDIKFFSIVLSYLKFHDFRYSFCKYHHEFFHKVYHIFSYMRFYLPKYDENIWQEGQGSERKG